MKNTTNLLLSAAALGCFLTLSTASADLSAGMKSGDPGMQSIGAIAFGPEGILFAADPKGASLVAMRTEDVAPGGGKAVSIEEIHAEVAAVLGTAVDEITIEDLAVNPASQRPYLAVNRGRGPDATPVVLSVGNDGKLAIFDTGKVEYSKVALSDAPEDKVVGQGRRRKNARMESITDLAYLDGKVVIAGLSNEEFASSLRSVEFPFGEKVRRTTVEVFHGAHGKFETHSPIRTFLPMDIEGEVNVVASYTCTPLVRFPVKQLEPGKHIKGTTVAELGNRNRPLDMIQYEKGGKHYILMANSSRGIMKIPTAGIGEIEGITERANGPTGLGYETIEDWSGVVQLDRLDDDHAVIIADSASGGAELKKVALP